MNRDFSVHCDYCQSFSDGYYCSNSNMFHVNQDGRTVARECYFQYIYDDEWEFHPCPFFIGEIRLHKENSYVARKIKVPNGYFICE